MFGGTQSRAGVHAVLIPGCFIRDDSQISSRFSTSNSRECCLIVSCTNTVCVCLCVCMCVLSFEQLFTLYRPYWNSERVSAENIEPTVMPNHSYTKHKYHIFKYC